MRLRLAQPEPVNMVADQHGRPTYAPDLAWALLRLAGQSDDGPAAPPGIYHFANSGACTWYELTMAIRERVANACDVRPVTTAEVPRPAKRPAYSVLDTTKYEAATGRVPTPWPLAVGRCLDVLALRERTKQER
jgi:dTDP-4-dehydrorhamnose reductase